MGVAAIASLDAFLRDVPSGRDITRVLRRALFDGERLCIVGDPECARRLAFHLVDGHPSEVHVAVVDPPGARVGNGRPGHLHFAASTASVGEGIRAALRQDPDVVLLTRLEGSGDVSLALTACETGHQVVAVLAAPDRAGGAALLEGAAGWTPGPGAMVTVGADGRIDAVDAFDVEAGTLVSFAFWSEPKSRYVSAVVTPRPEESRRGGEPVRHSRPPPARSPSARPSWVPRIEPSAASECRVAASRVTLPKGASWPACEGCSAPMQHVVQLDHASLPAKMSGAASLVSQLFLCAEGCDTWSASAPGVHVLAFERGATDEVSHPRPGAREHFGGGVVAWTERAEEPHAEDGGAPDRAAFPWDCDKLGGWPAWVQGAAWPECPECAARMTLLFQHSDAIDFVRAELPSWNDEDACLVAGAPRRLVYDPERPTALPDFLAGGDGVGYLFACAAHPRQHRYLWQTS
ncbi:MAG: ATPase, T2SS/T4P/T4SS family [Polyangiaceae bacterium]